jgi:hypothetical protein
METIEAPPKTRKSKATKRLVMFIKDKGGTGASMIARFLAELHQQRKTGVYLMDGDGTTASLSKHFGEPASVNASNPVHTFSLHGTERDRDTIADLLEVDAQRMILDLPATSLTVLRKIEAEYQWTGMLGENGWRPTVVASITPFEESIFDLGDAMEMFGDRADYVAVVNLGLAEEREDFEIWDEGETKPKFLERGGIELEFPRLKPRIVAKLQRKGVTFEGGRALPELSFSDRSRLATWISSAELALVPAADRLGLA